MFDLQRALADFGAAHTVRANRICHVVGLPAIAAAVLGALAHLRFVVADQPLDAAMLLLVCTFLLDAVLNVRIAVGVALAGAALYFAARPLPWAALGLLYALGWTLQLAGHRVFERNAPAFTQNALHLFVGPRWLINRVVRAIPELPAPSTGDHAQ